VLDGLLVEAAIESQVADEELRDRIAALEEQLWRLQSLASDSVVELDERTRAIDAVRDNLTRLDQQLHAPPALNDPSLLQIRDEHGREVIGFEGGTGNHDRDVYLGFENVFRSNETDVTDLQRQYVDLLRGHGPILDVGSGRGEFLDLLAAAGESARGVDSDEGMVTLSRAKGHDVALGDAIAYLRDSRCSESRRHLLCSARRTPEIRRSPGISP